MAHSRIKTRPGLLLALLLVWSVRNATCDCEPVTDGDGDLPDFTDYFKNDFTMVLEMTEIENNHTNYVKHAYFSGSDDGALVETSAVTILDSGSYIVYHYFPEENKYIEQFDDSCIENDETHPPYTPIGWYDNDTSHGVKMYGPATILRSAIYQKSTHEPNAVEVNGIECDMWYICIPDKKLGNIEVHLYFSAIGEFDMPEKGLFSEQGIADQIPVMFEVLPPDVSKQIQYTVVDFYPGLLDHPNIETPRGLSCEDKISVQPKKKPPSVPSHFYVAQEVVLNPFIGGVLYDHDQYLEKYQLSYSDDLSMVRLDISPLTNYTKPMHPPDKIIHDFNTGVQYSINREVGSCKLDFIPSVSFDRTNPGFEGGVGVMAGPNALFYLDKQYAYVGPRDVRSLQGDLYSSTRTDVPDPEKDFTEPAKKAVLDYYFLQGKEQSSYELTVPLRGDMFIYNESNPLNVDSMYTMNMFNPKKITLLSTDEFSVNECYDDEDDDWSSLYIFFPAKQIQFAAEATNEYEFKHNVFSTLLKVGDISPTRVGRIDVSDGTTGWYSNTSDSDAIVVEVRLMERAPYLYGYRVPDDPMEIPGDKELEKDVPDLESCAAMCTEEKDFQCKSFHYCSQQMACYLSNSENAEGPQTKSYACRHYIDNHENQTFDDLPTDEVDNRLRTFIEAKQFQFTMPYKNVEVPFIATQHLILKTPDITDPIRKQFYQYQKLATISNPDARYKPKDTSLLGCMALCIGWMDFKCETVVHDSVSGECMMYTQHASAINETRIHSSPTTNIQTRDYIIDYSYMLGGVSLNTSGPVVDGDSPEDCAQSCSNSKGFDCNSFEYCWNDYTCHLHVETFMDVSDGGNYSKHQPCLHFEKKAERIFTRYPNQGMPSKHNRLVAQLTGVSQCAQLCLQDTEETCESFDFCTLCRSGDYGVCGSGHKDGINMCFLSDHHITEPGIYLDVSDHCEHYSRNLFGNQDYAAWVASQRKLDKPYTGGAMAGLAIGMIITGILVGLVFLFALTKYSPMILPQEIHLGTMGSGARSSSSANVNFASTLNSSSDI